MANRIFRRRLSFVPRCLPAMTGGALRSTAGSVAWQAAGNGMFSGSGRVSAAGSAMR